MRPTWFTFWATLAFFLLLGALFSRGSVLVLWRQAPAGWQYTDTLEVTQCLEVPWDWTEVPGPYGVITNADGSLDNCVDASDIVVRTLPKKAFFRVKRQ